MIQSVIVHYISDINVMWHGARTISTQLSPSSSAYSFSVSLEQLSFVTEVWQSGRSLSDSKWNNSRFHLNILEYSLQVNILSDEEHGTSNINYSEFAE